jgi:hypothetical protein
MMMADQRATVVLTPRAARGRLGRVNGRGLAGDELVDVYTRLSGTRRPHVWVSESASEFAEVAGTIHGGQGNLRLLLLDEGVRTPQMEYLNTLFRSVVTAGTARILPVDELIDVLNSPDRADLFVAITADPVDRLLILYRGNLDRLVVPFDWFVTPTPAVTPDFDDWALLDYGQTVRLGDYEAAADAILYAFDPEYRRRAKERQIEQDEGFGAALRRLRLGRGLSRDDFPGIAAKTIARIERGEVEKPRDATLRQIADRLGVAPEEIETY